MNNADPVCPCGSGHRLNRCCGPLLAGSPAATAEALMRSRYSAYVLGDAGYLLLSWHASSRPSAVDPSEGPRWTGLEIRSATAGGADDSEGTVEFVAHFRAGERRGRLHETSRFLREDGRWLYVDGDIHDTDPATAGRVARNADCPCGSGRKFKRCCGP